MYVPGGTVFGASDALAGTNVGETVESTVGARVGQTLHVTGHAARIWLPYVLCAHCDASCAQVAGAPLMLRPVSSESLHLDTYGASVGLAVGVAVGDSESKLSSLLGAKDGTGVAHAWHVAGQDARICAPSVL